jgi:hypothetical protein
VRERRAAGVSQGLGVSPSTLCSDVVTLLFTHTCKHIRDIQQTDGISCGVSALIHALYFIVLGTFAKWKDFSYNHIMELRIFLALTLKTHMDLISGNVAAVIEIPIETHISQGQLPQQPSIISNVTGYSKQPATFPEHDQVLYHEREGDDDTMDLAEFKEQEETLRLCSNIPDCGKGDKVNVNSDRNRNAIANAPPSLEIDQEVINQMNRTVIGSSRVWRLIAKKN